MCNSRMVSNRHNRALPRLQNFHICMLFILVVNVEGFEQSYLPVAVRHQVQTRAGFGRTSQTLVLISESRVFPSHVPRLHPAALCLCKNSRKNHNYNDDAFGLVFLGSLALTQDQFFAVVFLTLSAIAALLTRRGLLNGSKAVPATVAWCTLLLTTMFRLTAHIPDLPASLPSKELLLLHDHDLIQAGLCMVSMAYGFLMSPKDENML